MKKTLMIVGVMSMTLSLQGCITDIVTAPIDLAFGVTKAVVKGTVGVVDAVIPDSKDKKDDSKSSDSK